MGEAEQEQTEPEEAEAPTPPETLPDEEEQEDGEDGEGEEEIIARVREAAPPPDAAKEQRRVEQALKREQKRHADNIAKLLGPAHEDALPCPLCFEGLQGYVFPGDGENLRDEQREAALAFLGVGGEPELRPAKGVRMCETCDGWGLLAFPTRREHTKEQTCPACNGSGYVLDQPESVTTTSLTILPPAALPVANGGGEACPSCGMAGMAGKPHYCAPQTATVT